MLNGLSYWKRFVNENDNCNIIFTRSERGLVDIEEMILIYAQSCNLLFLSALLSVGNTTNGEGSTQTSLPIKHLFVARAFLVNVQLVLRLVKP